MLSFPPARGLLSKHYDLLWTHGAVVDADIVDQAGEEGAGGHKLVGANVQAAIRTFQAILRVFGDLDVIHIQNPVSPVPYEADAVPMAVGDNGLGL